MNQMDSTGEVGWIEAGWEERNLKETIRKERKDRQEQRDLTGKVSDIFLIFSFKYIWIFLIHEHHSFEVYV